MCIPLLAALNRYKKIIRDSEYAYHDNVHLLFIPYTYAGSPGIVLMYYIRFNVSCYSSAYAKIYTGAVFSGTFSGGRIQRSNYHICRYL